ncbi:hypothetical protein [Sorangium sp. So ce363]|uniref:hypothetical protein n=1 Tax=Sorangium sp. So ce363 TaxID=3133304 RepID=UPI003F607F33
MKKLVLALVAVSSLVVACGGSAPAPTDPGAAPAADPAAAPAADPAAAPPADPAAAPPADPAAPAAPAEAPKQ